MLRLFQQMFYMYLSSVIKIKENVDTNYKQRLVRPPHSIDRLIDWLIEWMNDWLIDWLIGFYVEATVLQPYDGGQPHWMELETNQNRQKRQFIDR